MATEAGRCISSKRNRMKDEEMPRVALQEATGET